MARVAPAPRAAPVAELSLRTPEGTTNILQLLGKARLGPGGLWQGVRPAVLPNGTTGWVPRSARGSPVLRDTRLLVNPAHFRATLFRDGAPVFGALIGVGPAQSPTPAGNFYVRDVLTRYRSPTYGPIAFGTSARSATLTDWPAGGYVGIHGTDRPSLIPGGDLRQLYPDAQWGHPEAGEGDAGRHPNERVPPQLIQQFPLDQQTTQTANPSSTGTSAAATGLRTHRLWPQRRQLRALGRTPTRAFRWSGFWRSQRG